MPLSDLFELKTNGCGSHGNASLLFTEVTHHDIGSFASPGPSWLESGFTHPFGRWSEYRQHENNTFIPVRLRIPSIYSPTFTVQHRFRAGFATDCGVKRDVPGVLRGPIHQNVTTVDWAKETSTSRTKVNSDGSLLITPLRGQIKTHPTTNHSPSAGWIRKIVIKCCL